jgi:hypothetical protein
MSFKRLQLIVTVSKFLALTPWSSDAKPTFNEKLYSSLVIISLTLFAVAGLVWRGFLSQSHSLQNYREPFIESEFVGYPLDLNC